MKDREFDLILHGSTGFVGLLTARYIAEHAPDGLRWALSGRNIPKLEQVRDELVEIDKSLADLPLIEADSLDDDAMNSLAARARMITSTVGPYARFGEPLVRACAEAGTDYADLTGEPGFVDEMYVKHHKTALASGARLIHCGGFDAMPADLGAYFTVLQLPEGQPITIESRVHVAMRPSGGTFYSALNGFASGPQTLLARRRRKQAEPKPAGRKVGMLVRPLKRDSEMEMWTSPLPTIDQAIVEYSAALLERYGPDFRYGHNYAARSFRTIPFWTTVVGGVFVAAQVPPLRKLMMRRLPPGDGPDAEQRAKHTFRVEFIGRTPEAQVRTRISGGDGGYDETAKMLSELTFAVLFDDVPERSGSLTPVAAAGDSLLKRLPAAGIPLEVL